MKQYKDIHLKIIQNILNIDFARYTYSRGQCSCCYGPTDMPKRYWKDGIIKSKDYSYILFKNAYNGSGIVSKNDWITNNTFIQYDNLTPEQMSGFCQALQSQLDSDYLVLEPIDDSYCICIKCKSEGLFKMSLTETKEYKHKFNQTQLNKLIVDGVSYIYFDSSFEIAKSE